MSSSAARREVSTQDDQLRLLGIDFGPPFDVRTFSGSSRYIWTELRRRGVLVDAFTPYPSRAVELLYKARAFRPGTQRWRASWRRSLPFRECLSRRAMHRIAAEYAERVNATLQIGAYYDVCDAPVARRGLLADNNCAITQRTNVRFQSSRAVFERQFAFERRIYNAMDCVFCFSEFLAQSMVEDFGCDAQRVLVVSAGLNADEGALCNPDRDFRSRIILFAGLDWVQKGGPTLLAAFDLVRRRLPDTRLELLGPTLRQVPPGVTCHGRLSKDDPRQLARICAAYRRATVFALPTLADAYPNVIREAMAAGLPCVATRIGAIPEMIVDGVTGFLIPPDDPAWLADRLLRLLQDPPLSRAMGAAGFRRYRERYSWTRICGRITAALEAGLRPSATPRRDSSAS